MLSKKFHIPIGILIFAICAVGFLSLRSDVSHPLSEGIVVPESVVAEANRFREWSEKQEAHGKARAEHDSKDEQLARRFTQKFCGMADDPFLFNAEKHC